MTSKQDSSLELNAFGLSHTREEADIILLPVPFDLTCSYRPGTASAPRNIMKASPMMDFPTSDFSEMLETGIFCEAIPFEIDAINTDFRARATQYMTAYDKGVDISLDPDLLKIQHDLNEASKILRASTYERAEKAIEENKIVGLIGGEHSCSLGVIEALADYVDNFAVLQIDAHMDLRDSYQGLTYSHASVMRNVLGIKDVNRLIQVGIRDYCDEEVFFAQDQKGRVKTYFASDIHEQLFIGKTWDSICKKIINNCPEHVYVSLDIDGLCPSLCSQTGTPVPGGLSYHQVVYLLKSLVKAKKKIVGFDLVEVSGAESSVDVIVAAHLLYQLCGLAWLSQEQTKD
jgi:agmatinase